MLPGMGAISGPPGFWWVVLLPPGRMLVPHYRCEYLSPFHERFLALCLPAWDVLRMRMLSWQAESPVHLKRCLTGRALPVFIDRLSRPACPTQGRCA